MRYASIFSGVEAATLAWEPLGWEPMAFSEIEPFPCAVLAERWPDVPNLGDITKVDWNNEIHGAVDLVVGGSPCFPAGTLVLREDGYVPIEEIKVGDMVVSHTGKLRKVLATGSKIADTVILKGAGTDEIECTPNHPFYATEKEKVWVNEERQYRMIPTGDFSWTKAEEMKGKYWLNVCEVDGGGIPHFSGAGKGQRGKGYIDDFEFGYDFFYFVGRWLGDGWANAHERKDRVDSQMKRVYVCCSFDEADTLEERLKRTGIHFGRTHDRTTDRFAASSTQLYDWLTDNFGVHADGKKIPAWCLGIDADLKRAIFEGYMDSDGCVYNGKSSSTSINKALCLGIKAIAGSLGCSTCLVKSTPNRVAYIEGRKVNERPQFRQQYESSPRSSFFVDKGWCGLVRKVLPGRNNVRVYNLEVEIDNSYAADGIAVHNCQSFSVAGKREGLKGASGLMFEYIRCVQELRPRWFLWENVPGALTSENGGAFGQLLREMDELGYSLAWRVLDAQFFGVAQRRRRLFLVGYLGAESPAEVLFEPDCLSGNPQSSCEKRKELANRAGRSAACAGFKYNAAPRANTIGYAVEQANTLTADWHAPAVLSLPNTALSQYGTEVCTSDYASTPPLRRLTPLECERLQGFPDNHTRISWKGKPAEECPDGPRYKAIGNSMAVPVMRWIGERIAMAEAGGIS